MTIADGILLALGISTALIFIEGAIIDWWLGDKKDRRES